MVRCGAHTSLESQLYGGPTLHTTVTRGGRAWCPGGSRIWNTCAPGARSINCSRARSMAYPSRGHRMLSLRSPRPICLLRVAVSDLRTRMVTPATTWTPTRRMTNPRPIHPFLASDAAGCSGRHGHGFLRPARAQRRPLGRSKVCSGVCEVVDAFDCLSCNGRGDRQAPCTGASGAPTL